MQESTRLPELSVTIRNDREAKRWGALVGLLKRQQIRDEYIDSLNQATKTKAQENCHFRWAQSNRCYDV